MGATIGVCPRGAQGENLQIFHYSVRIRTFRLLLDAQKYIKIQLCCFVMHSPAEII
jgi:hypothetical protein